MHFHLLQRHYSQLLYHSPRPDSHPPMHLSRMSPGHLPLYHKLRGEGYGIYLLSNFFTEGFAMLDRLYDFIRDADGRIVSSHVHLRKPQPEIYQALLDRYSLKPEECIFFDDRQVNADAAAAQGIRAVRFLNVRQAEEDFRCFSRFN